MSLQGSASFVIGAFRDGVLNRGEVGDEAERPHWAELIRSGVVIFDLDYDAILAAMYALSVSAEGDFYLYVPPDLGIEAVDLGVGDTTLTPLSAPVPVILADPSRGPVLACSSTVLPCPAVPSGSMSDIHLPSFSTNLVSTAALQDAMVTTTTLGGQRVSICMCTQTGRHLATSTRRPGSSLYTLATEPPQVAASAQESASGLVAPPCSCCLLSHQTLLWHHRLGHPSLPRLRGMHSRLLVSGLPRSLPPLPPSPTPPCLPCVEGEQRAAPHSSSFSPTTAPLQILHMDVWGPARVSGQGRERYFLLVVDDYTRYTKVFSLRSKGKVPNSFMLPDSPQQNRIAERRIGLVMEVARTSMIHAAAPHFLWPSAVRYAARQLNLWPCVSLPETSPTLRWTMMVGDASAFRFYHPTSRRVFTSQDVTFDKLVPFHHLFPCRSAPPPPSPLFLAPGPPPVYPIPPQGPAPSRVSQVDPLRGTLPVEVAVDSGVARGAESGGAASGGAEPGGAEPGGAEPGGAEPGGAESEGARFRGAEPGGAEPRGAEPAGVESGGAEPEGVEPGGADSRGAEPRGTASSGGPAGASPRLSPRPEPLSPQQLREWFMQCTRLWSGATGAGDSGAGCARVTSGAGGTGGAAAAGPEGARTRGTGAAGTGSVGGVGAGDSTEPGAAGAGGSGVGGPGAGGAGAGGAGAVGAGAGGAGAVDPRAGGAGAGGSWYPSSLGLTPPLLCPPPDQSQPLLQPASAVPAPSPYTEHVGGLTKRRVPSSCPASPVRTSRRVPQPCPPPVPGIHAMALYPSSVPSTDASALVAELLDFAAACRLEYATSLVAESESASPPSIRGERALGTDVLEDRQEDFEYLAAGVPRFASMLLAPAGDPDAPDIPTPRSYADAITGPYSSQWQAAMDAEMASWKCTGTYVDEVPPPGANIVDGMWIFRVKRPPGSPPAFKARYVARGFSQQQGAYYFHTFSSTPKMTTLRVLLHVATQRDYELHSLDFSTVFLQGSLHEEIWLRRPPGFTGSFLDTGCIV
ncbi:unnamed protein product [Closterium sp. NIES-53]